MIRQRFETLTVRAYLATPPVLSAPVLFDGILLGGLGAEMGAAHTSGWEDEEIVCARVPELPLARVETAHGWWFAASQVGLDGPEALDHKHRRAPAELYARYAPNPSYNQASGPDKSLRVPFYTRPGMLVLTWTCVGDPRRIAELLAQVWSIGRLVCDGHGWVDRWEITRGGPPQAAYASDVRLRHLPIEDVSDVPALVTRRLLPLRPPYWRRRDGVAVWQVAA